MTCGWVQIQEVVSRHLFRVVSLLNGRFDLFPASGLVVVPAVPLQPLVGLQLIGILLDQKLTREPSPSPPGGGLFCFGVTFQTRLLASMQKI
jgi:hypothetical protein